MIFKIYSVLDTKAGAFAPPFFLANDTVAVRTLAAARSDETTLYAKFPNDFQLFCIGDFDDELGIIGPSSPRLIVETL